MSIQDTIRDLEEQMAALKARIDEGNAKAKPHRDKLDALNAQQLTIQAEIDETVKVFNAARGDPKEWINLKRKYGQLASARMQLRQALKAL
jgi:uncharacterized coiled-coil DUF342 family protein